MIWIKSVIIVDCHCCIWFSCPMSTPIEKIIKASDNHAF
jgi:hypothetical protein